MEGGLVVKGSRLEYSVEKVENFSHEILLGIRDLFRACYGAQELDRGGRGVPSIEELRWRYANAPFGAEVWIAKYNNRTIGLRPSVRRRIKVDGESYECAQFMNAMTHPGFRRKGIYSSLLKESVSDLRRQGISMIYTFPNNKSFPIYRKLEGWTWIGDLKLLVKPIVPIPKRKYISSYGEVGGALATMRISEFNSGFKDFLAVCLGHRVAIDRMVSYLNWRYMERPGIKYAVYSIRRKDDISGYIVLRTKRIYGISIGIVSEFMVQEGDTLSTRALLQVGIGWLRDRGARLVVFGCSPNSWILDSVRNEGFLCLHKRLLFRRSPVVVRITNDFKACDALLNINNWLVMLGDNDAA